MMLLLVYYNSNIYRLLAIPFSAKATWTMSVILQTPPPIT